MTTSTQIPRNPSQTPKVGDLLVWDGHLSLPNPDIIMFVEHVTVDMFKGVIIYKGDTECVRKIGDTVTRGIKVYRKWVGEVTLKSV